jgi:hypothetical protein
MCVEPMREEVSRNGMGATCQKRWDQCLQLHHRESSSLMSEVGWRGEDCAGTDDAARKAQRSSCRYVECSRASAASS